MSVNINILLTTYTGIPGSRPPYTGAAKCNQDVPLPHDLDGHSTALLVSFAGQTSIADMGFVLHINDSRPDGFEWVSLYPVVIPDGLPLENILDYFGVDEGYIECDGCLIIPLKKGDRWALWPTPEPDTANQGALGIVGIPNTGQPLSVDMANIRSGEKTAATELAI